MHGATTSDAHQALESWRRAEAAYREATAGFLLSDGTSPHLGKDELINLIALRRLADACREKYFLVGEHAHGGQ